MPVVKRDKSIRICWDFKLTAMWEDLFVALSGGTVLTKLDLSQVYLKVEVDDTCKKSLTVNIHKGLLQFNRLPFGVSQLLQFSRD